MAKTGRKNHYEFAFESWLADKNIDFVTVDQSKRTAFKNIKIKSFDYMVSARDGRVLLLELKGRKFKGQILRENSALQCWITMDDVNSLDRWQNIFGTDYTVALIFAYEIETPAIDAEHIFYCADRAYSFFVIDIDDYKNNMVLRSARWKTVALLAEPFRKYAKAAAEILV